MKKLLLLEILMGRKTSDTFFLSACFFTHQAKGGTCCKNPRKPSCIDLSLTNSPLNFQNFISVFTGISHFSDFHKFVPIVFKTTLTKSKPKVVSYIDYKNFNHECFENDLKYA